MTNRNSKQPNKMTEGSIPKILFTFTVPIFFSNLLQSMYSFVDRIWLGRLLGPSGLAAISTSMPAFFLIISLAVGFAMASTILIAQYYGADDHESLSKTISTTYAFSLISSFSITIIGLLATKPLLRLINTPPEAFDSAVSYMRIMFMGMIFIFAYNMFGAILRGLGDSKTPLVFVIIATVINMVLDPMMIAGIWIFPKMGAAGAAYATVIAQAVAAVLCYYYLKNRKHIVEVKFRTIKIHKDIMKKMFKLGLPTSFQQGAMSISSLFLMALVNSFGLIFAAGISVAWQIESMIFLPGMALNSSVAAFSGQNVGALKFDRVLKSLKWGIIYIYSILLVGITFCIIFAPQISSIFSDDSQIIAVSVDYIRLVSWTYFIYAVTQITNGIIHGAGGTKFTMV
ncbi:MAG: MATE family efflux transporter, partial [Clostridia bacterium]|nr:MATE family efflux transporter [Clostridia bacterium]